MAFSKFEFEVELNMDTSNIVKVQIWAKNETNAIKLGLEKAKKENRAFTVKKITEPKIIK